MGSQRHHVVTDRYDDRSHGTAHGLTLVTDNRKDFPMPELNIHPLK